MKKKYSSLFMVCAAVILCFTMCSEKSLGLGVGIVEGQPYENYTDGASSAGVTAGVNMNTMGTLNVINNTFTGNTSTGSLVNLGMGDMPGGGGALYDWNGKLLNVQGSIFEQNKSTASGYYNGGGAILLLESRSVQIDNSIFNNNSAAEDGGAIYSHNANNVVISNSQFTGNHADSKGGAIRFYNFPTSNLKNTINDVVFERNSASQGGAVFVEGNIATFENLTFNNNTAEQYGGAMYIDRSYGGQGERGVTLNNSHFTGNRAEADGAQGGAIYAGGTFNVNDSEFKDNYATLMGGAIYLAHDGSGSVITNTEFTNNSTEYLGGAIAVSEGALQINNSKFENNYAGTRGGAIHFSVTQNNTSDSMPTKTLFVHNTDFINNSAGQDGGAIYVNVSQDSNIRGLKWVRIVSNDGKTHEFTGNMHNTDNESRAPESNALFVQSGTVNLITKNEGSKLLFNDGIAGQNYGERTDSKLVLDGDIIFNGQVKNIEVTQKGGTLTLNQTGNNNLAEGKAILENVDLYFEAGEINMANDNLDTLNLGLFEIRTPEDLKLALDADLAQGKSDLINVTKDMRGGIKFDAEHIDIKIKDGNSKYFQLFNRVGDLFSWPTGEELVQYSSTKKYTLTLGEDGVVNVATDTTNGLADAVSSSEDSRVYRSEEDVSLKDSGSLGKMSGEYLKVNFDGADLDGAGNGGIIVAEGQKLEMVNMGSGDGKKSVHDFGDSVVENAGEVIIKNSEFRNNSTEQSGAVLNNSGDAIIYDSSFIDNKAEENGGAINNSGNLTITADKRDVVFSGNTANGVGNDIHMEKANVEVSEESVVALEADTTPTLTLNGSKNITLNDGISGEGTVIKEDSGTLNLGGDNSNYTGDVHYNGGVTNLLKDAKYFAAANTYFENGSMLNLINNQVNNVNFGNLYLGKGGGRLGLDVNIINGDHDTIAANSVTGDGKLVIDRVNVLYDSKSSNPIAAFDIIQKDAEGNSPLVGKVELDPNNGVAAYGPIYKYGVGFDSQTGQMLLTTVGGKSYKGYNPAVMTGPVGALAGAYLTQLNSYDMAFNNMDMYMLMPKDKRYVNKYRNKYALTEENGTYSRSLNQYEDRGAWFKPYSTFENVGLNNGPKVHNVGYGSFFGADSDLTQLKNGFDGMWSVYAGYNGSHQSFSGNGIYQNGGQLGVTGVVYKENFFSALTANVGASVGEASTMFGHDNFTMLTAGIASKTGYNWELANGRFIFQPSYLMSYSFVNTFDYHNAAGVSMTSDALNVLQISPGLKFICNLNNGWQPYLGFSIVWNLMDDTKFRANNVSLPQLSVDPYFNYGLGVQKTVGERFTCFLQAMFRSGGRAGVGLQFALRYRL